MKPFSKSVWIAPAAFGAVQFFWIVHALVSSGPEETRAWTIQKNCTAPKAAGEIHTDFEKGFIRAETVSYDDFISNDGWVNSKTNGKMRLEGKDYIVKDRDVLNFRFNTWPNSFHTKIN